MKTTLKLLSPSESFLLGSSTSFAGLELPSAFGLVTTGYHNGRYSLSTVSWNIGRTVCILKSNGTQLDIPEGALAVLPDVPEVKTQGPVIRIPAKSLILKEDAKGLSILRDTDELLFRISLHGQFAYMVLNNETPAKLTEWHYLMQASSALKRIVDAGVGKSEEQQRQLLLNYFSDINRTVACFDSVYDNLKEPDMHSIRVYRLDVVAFGKATSLYLYQRENDCSDVEPIFENAFQELFPDISAMGIFLRQLDFLRDDAFGVTAEIEYLQKQTDVIFNLHISSMMLPERAMSALTMNKVFRA